MQVVNLDEDQITVVRTAKPPSTLNPIQGIFHYCSVLIFHCMARSSSVLMVTGRSLLLMSTARMRKKARKYCFHLHSKFNGF